jgi:FhuF 2Fe-2S C-terminal domain/Ferric iron reductase FhuF-like transporter
VAAGDYLNLAGMNGRPRVDASAALAVAAGAGPYFVIEPLAGGGPWRPLRVLAAEPAVLRERVAHARGVLERNAGAEPGQVPERAAASIVFLGLASRLVSPSLAAAVLGGVVPHLTLDDLWWRPVDGGPLPLAARPASGIEIGELAPGAQLGDAADLLAAGCVEGLAAPLAAAFGTLFRLSPRVLWGNVASALAGAAGMLAAAFPGRAEAAGRLAAEVLARGPLRGTGELVRPDPAQPRRFLVRRSCCLFYRVPEGGTCGDCVLTPEDVRRRQWQAVLSPGRPQNSSSKDTSPVTPTW